MTRPSPESDYGVPAVSPATPGENNSRNNDSLDANMSQHLDVSASVRPTYLLAGATWAKDTGASPQVIEVYFFDGTDDILLYTIDTAANTVTRSKNVGEVVNVETATSVADDSTASPSPANSSLVIPYTAKFANSKLLISCSAFGRSGTVGSSNNGRLMETQLYDATDAVVIDNRDFGRNLAAAATQTARSAFNIVYSEEVYFPGDTDPHTYRLRFNTSNANTTVNIDGATESAGFITVKEIKQ